MRRTAVSHSAASRLLNAFGARVFSTAAAREHHVSVDTLQRLVSLGDCRRVVRGAYQLCLPESDEFTALLHARLGRVSHDEVIAHVTAARLHGLRAPFQAQLQDDTPWFLRRPDDSSPSRRNGVAVLPAHFEPEHVQDLDGLRVTTLARTAMDLARGCRLERALIPLDHALARGVPRGALVELAIYMKGWPGSRVFKLALSMLDALAESSLESMARAIVWIEGIATPVSQFEVRGASRRRYRADFAWPSHRVILEIDGAEKYPTPESIYAEKRREDDLRRAGWQVHRWTYDDMTGPDRRAITRLKRVLPPRPPA